MPELILLAIPSAPIDLGRRGLCLLRNPMRLVTPTSDGMGQARDAWGLWSLWYLLRVALGQGCAGWVREEPCPCLQVRCSLAVGGGSLLLAAVPSSAIALCLPLPPRGAGGELPEKGGMVLAALHAEILGGKEGPVHT